MVKDKSSLDVFKDYNPSEDLRKPPSKGSSGAPAAPTPAPAAPAQLSAPAAVAPPPPPQSTQTPSTPRSSSTERIFASPLARKLASEKGIDLSLIQIHKNKILI